MISVAPRDKKEPDEKKIFEMPALDPDNSDDVLKVVEALGLDYHLGMVVHHLARGTEADLLRARWLIDRKLTIMVSGAAENLPRSDGP